MESERISTEEARARIGSIGMIHGCSREDAAAAVKVLTDLANAEAALAAADELAEAADRAISDPLVSRRLPTFGPDHFVYLVPKLAIHETRAALAAFRLARQGGKP